MCNVWKQVSIYILFMYILERKNSSQMYKNVTNATMPFAGWRFANAKWGKAKQMQPMRLCILLSGKFEGTFENGESQTNATNATLNPSQQAI